MCSSQLLEIGGGTNESRKCNGRSREPGMIPLVPPQQLSHSVAICFVYTILPYPYHDTDPKNMARDLRKMGDMKLP